MPDGRYGPLTPSGGDLCAADPGEPHSAAATAREELLRLLEGLESGPGSLICVRADRRKERVVAAGHTGHSEGDYRWCLDVRFTDAAGRLLPGYLLPVVQMNPSTACARRSDSTRGKVEAWARKQPVQYGGVRLLNLFAVRSTSPGFMHGLSHEVAVGGINDRLIERALASAPVVIAAWGEHKSEPWLWETDGGAPSALRRVRYVASLVGTDRLAYVGRMTQGRYPLHGGRVPRRGVTRRVLLRE
jgi:hypothetical protein